MNKSDGLRRKATDSRKPVTAEEITNEYYVGFKNLEEITRREWQIMINRLKIIGMEITRKDRE